MTPKKLQTPRGKFDLTIVMQYLRTHGQAKTSELHAAIGATAPSQGAIQANMRTLAKAGIVANHEKFGTPAIWYLAGQMPEPITQPEPEPEIVEDESDKPPYYDSQKGNFIGDRLQGFGISYFIYKVRVKNSNIQKGKNAGYRLIYLLESETSILLLTIYSKAENEDIIVGDINSILSEYFIEE
jgi:mRNA-degrading endonuclease RelE of RelBE toxin-antitoxin system